MDVQMENRLEESTESHDRTVEDLPFLDWALNDVPAFERAVIAEYSGRVSGNGD